METWELYLRITVIILISVGLLYFPKSNNWLKKNNSAMVGLGTFFLGTGALFALLETNLMLDKVLKIEKKIKALEDAAAVIDIKEASQSYVDNSPVLSSKDASLEKIEKALLSDIPQQPGTVKPRAFLPENALKPTATSLFETKDIEQRKAILYQALKYGEKEQTTDD